MSSAAPPTAAPGAPCFGLDGAHLQFAAAVRLWVAAEVAPHAAAVDAGAFPGHAIGSAAARGYMGIVVPARYGGLGLDHLSFALFVEEVARACASTAVALDVHASVGTEPLLMVGGDALRARFLPDLAAGRLLGAFALTEPEAGSDAASLRTTARRDGDHYVLSGSKIFITNAGHAGLYTVLASTDRDLGARGISAFLVPADTRGLGVGPPQHKLGLRGSATAELILRDCRIPAENRLGADGDGFRIAMLALDSGRIGISAQALGIAGAALDEVIRLLAAHAERPGAVAQGAQFALADMATAIEAARALTWQAARSCDAGEPFTTVASMAKLASTDTAMAVATTALDLAATVAPVSALAALERCFRDAKATQLYEGTNQIQRVVIARRILGG